MSPTRILSQVLFHKAMAAMVAMFAYFAINLLALQFMDENNGVIDGKLFPNSDHWPIAQQLISGEELSNFRYPPGFALYIAMAFKAQDQWGGSYFVWRLAQDCLSTGATAFLLMTLMLRLTNSLWAGWCANLYLIANLTYSAGTATDLAMASFLPWFYAGLLAIVVALERSSDRVYSFAAGIFVGISGFIRPDILLLLPFIGMMLGAFRGFSGVMHSSRLNQRLAHTFYIALLGFIAIVLPWTIYTSIRSGSLILYSTGFIPSHIDGMARFPDNPVSKPFLQIYLSSAMHSMSLWDLVCMHFALLRSHPADWLMLWMEKLWHPWYASISQRWNVILAVQTLILMPPVVAGVYIWLRKKRLDLGFTLGMSVISYFWLISIVVLSIARYMPPAYPFLGMFAGYAMESLWKEVQLAKGRFRCQRIKQCLRNTH